MNQVSLAPNDLNHFFAQIRPVVFAFCYRISGDTELAEDVAQDTLVDAFLEIRENEGRASRSAAIKIACAKLSGAVGDLKPWTFKEDQLIRPVLTPESFWQSIKGENENRSTKIDQRDSLSIGFLTLLQHLPFIDRIVYVLTYVLGVTLDGVLDMTGKSGAQVKAAQDRAEHFMVQHFFAPHPKQILWRQDGDYLPALERFVEILNQGDRQSFKHAITSNFSCILFPTPLFQHEIFFNDFLGQGIRTTVMDFEINGQRAFAFEKDRETQAIAVIVNSPKGVATILGYDADTLLPKIRKMTADFMR